MWSKIRNFIFGTDSVKGLIERSAFRVMIGTIIVWVCVALAGGTFDWDEFWIVIATQVGLLFGVQGVSKSGKVVK